MKKALMVMILALSMPWTTAVADGRGGLPRRRWERRGRKVRALEIRERSLSPLDSGLRDDSFLAASVIPRTPQADEGSLSDATCYLFDGDRFASAAAFFFWASLLAAV